MFRRNQGPGLQLRTWRPNSYIFLTSSQISSPSGNFHDSATPSYARCVVFLTRAVGFPALYVGRAVTDDVPAHGRGLD